IPALAGCGSAESPAAAATPAPAKTGVVTVSGHGSVDGRPDTLTIQIGVESKGQSARATLDDASTKAQSVIDALGAKGVAKKDIQTSQLSVTPTYDLAGHVTGFSASNMLTATLRDMTAAGAVIDAAAGVAGDSIRINGVSFSIADTSALMVKARAD